MSRRPPFLIFLPLVALIVLPAKVDAATARLADWYDGRSLTQRLSVWNLQSRLGPIALLKRLSGTLRGA